LLYKPFVEVGGAEPCVAAVGYGPEEYGMLADGSPDLVARAAQEPVYAGLLEGYLDEGYAPCAGSAVPTITPRLWAESWVRAQVLPVPAPRIGAGRFVVGLEAFLETGTSLRLERVDASPFGSAVLSLRSDVVVDWGDGRGEDGGPFASVGGPYPGGDITHVYQEMGFYDVVVTQRWTLDWSVGGAGGTITGVETTGTLADFEVFAVEAVIVDPGARGPSPTIARDPGE
jgi:hypothetical protein